MIIRPYGPGFEAEHKVFSALVTGVYESLETEFAESCGKTLTSIGLTKMETDLVMLAIDHIIAVMRSFKQITNIVNPDPTSLMSMSNLDVEQIMETGLSELELQVRKEKLMRIVESKNPADFFIVPSAQGAVIRTENQAENAIEVEDDTMTEFSGHGSYLSGTLCSHEILGQDLELVLTDEEEQTTPESPIRSVSQIERTVGALTAGALNADLLPVSTTNIPGGGYESPDEAVIKEEQDTAHVARSTSTHQLFQDTSLSALL